ncbi:MAG: bifunctional glycosyltransferase family 2/GtrA family protein [Clostridia bacterium]|nr:bifunctional glycosyltransferase family 2/GtrA family protein [Clostridia bacterium]
MDAIKRITIIIPSLSPDDKLLSLLADLRETGFAHILLVNDGSSAEYDSYFTAAKTEYGCTVLTHAVNQGKGRALKTAFNYLLAECPECIGSVTVDSDGQHRIADIIKVAQETVAHPEALIMGCRDFSPANTDIPPRSRFGNVTTSRVLRMLCGITLSDTQTGLRGFSPQAMRQFMKTRGERFEYEMNMILDAKENDIPLIEVPIETVYIEENRTSHFNPLKDSLRIYSVFAKFIASSLSSFAVDILLYSFFCWLMSTVLVPDMPMGNVILVATFAARILSALFNYFVNRKGVFKSKGDKGGSLLRYAVVCVVQVCISAFATRELYELLHWGETLLKVLVDTALFLVSFRVQRSWVFRSK